MEYENISLDKLGDFILAIYKLNDPIDCWNYYLSQLKKFSISDAMYYLYLSKDVGGNLSEAEEQSNLSFISTFSKPFNQLYIDSKQYLKNDKLLLRDQKKEILDWPKGSFMNTYQKELNLAHGFTIPISFPYLNAKAGFELSATGVSSRSFKDKVKPHINYILAISDVFAHRIQQLDSYSLFLAQNTLPSIKLNQEQLKIVGLLASGMSQAHIGYVIFHGKSILEAKSIEVGNGKSDHAKKMMKKINNRLSTIKGTLGAKSNNHLISIANNMNLI